jgi:hypothetical protein
MTEERQKIYKKKIKKIQGKEETKKRERGMKVLQRSYERSKILTRGIGIMRGHFYL